MTRRFASRPTLPRPPPSIPVRRPDQPLLGIAFVVSAGIVFSLTDAISKHLAERLPVLEIIWLRWLGVVAVALPAIVASRGAVLRSRAPGLQALRVAALLGSSTLFTAGLAYLPLASATTINFVSPLIVTALSIPLLGETVGPRRWAAVLVGLAGVVIVVRPGSGTFGWAALFPVLSACCWATAVVATRKLGRIDGTWTAMSLSALLGLVALTASALPVFVVPSGAELGIALLMAATNGAGQFFTLQGYTRAPASLVVPFIYVTLVWSSLLGYLFFGTVPDVWTWIGASVIVASGIYTAHRERVRAREAALRG